jgi:hypothetical protein
VRSVHFRFEGEKKIGPTGGEFISKAGPTAGHEAFGKSTERPFNILPRVVVDCSLPSLYGFVT